MLGPYAVLLEFIRGRGRRRWKIDIRAHWWRNYTETSTSNKPLLGVRVYLVCLMFASARSSNWPRKNKLFMLVYMQTYTHTRTFLYWIRDTQNAIRFFALTSFHSYFKKIAPKKTQSPAERHTHTHSRNHAARFFRITSACQLNKNRWRI